MVRLEGYGKRKPGQLSGGQRQRVALARAIVNRPKALLLDEPLGALDLKLRQELQIELKQIQQELGLTFVYVTHDQEEALTMSRPDRRVQPGPDRADRDSRGAVRASEDGVRRRLHRQVERARAGRTALHRAPEKIRVLPGDATEGEPGVVRAAVYLGAVTRFVVALDGGGELVALQQNLEVTSSDVRAMEGRPVRLAWSPDVEFVIKGERENADSLVARRARRAGRLARGAGTRRVEDRCRVPTSIGEGEGKLTLVAWEGYTDKSWVAPFEKQTGCKVSGEVRRQLGRDGQPDAVRRRRPVRHGLGIGRREPAAHLRRRRRRDEREPRARLEGLPVGVKSPRLTPSRASTTASRSSSAQLVLYNTKKESKPTSWSAIYDPKNKGKITIPDNPIQIADAALYLSKTQPSLGIKDPVRARPEAARRRGRAAQEAEAAAQETGCSASDQIDLFKNGGSTLGASWPYQLSGAGVSEGSGRRGGHPRKASPAGWTPG